MRRLLLILALFTLIVIIGIPVGIIYFTAPFEMEERVKISPGTTELRVLIRETGQVEVMDLEEYLVGTVAAEMPALFELEALKAQAVAARTYALKRKDLALNQNNPHHPEADVCTDATHCQAWFSAKEMKDRWGMIQYYSHRKKIKKAVQDTAGVVATYKGKLIDPVYHSTSNGKTENAGDVWKLQVEYLKSVESPWDLESPKYQSQVSYLLPELAARLGLSPESLASQGNLPLKTLELTGGGRIKKIQVGSKVLTGEEFRRLLDLNSADVTWERQGEQVVFTTKGYGHGVGMSQYGANGMAREGRDYREILTYYYPGIQLYRVTE